MNRKDSRNLKRLAFVGSAVWLIIDEVRLRRLSREVSSRHPSAPGGLLLPTRWPIDAHQGQPAPRGYALAADARALLGGCGHDDDPQESQPEHEVCGGDRDCDPLPTERGKSTHEAADDRGDDEESLEGSGAHADQPVGDQNGATQCPCTGLDGSHKPDHATRTTSSLEDAERKRWVSRALKVLWATFFVISAWTAATVSGGSSATPSAWVGILAGLNIILGTLIAFAQIPNREGQFAENSDL